MRTASLVLVLVLLLPASGHTVIFHDGLSNAQRMIEFVENKIEQVRHYAVMIEQYKTMADTLKQSVTMVEQQAKQLANMPHGGIANLLDWIGTETQTASAVLGTINRVGFDLDKSTQQFTEIYKDLRGAETSAGKLAIVQRMQSARQEMMGVAIQVQSVRQTFAGIFARLQALIGAATLSEGVKAVAQVQVSQQALAQQQQQVGLTVQAVQARLQTMKDAEQLAVQQLDYQAAQQHTQWNSLGSWQEAPPLAITQRGTWQ